MNVRTNKIMEDYLVKLSFDFRNNSIDLPVELEKIITSELLIENDCITLKEIYGNKKIPILENDIEKCEWEYDQSHFHPDEYARKHEDELEYLILALECAKRLTNRFKQKFKERKFRTIVSFNETEKIKGKIEIYGSSTVRFYQVRSSCEKIMRTEDLDDFKLDAILEIE